MKNLKSLMNPLSDSSCIFQHGTKMIGENSKGLKDYEEEY